MARTRTTIARHIASALSDPSGDRGRGLGDGGAVAHQARRGEMSSALGGPVGDVAGALVGAVTALVPGASCALIARIGAGWQMLAHAGSQDLGRYFERHLATVDLELPERVIAARHLVSALPAAAASARVIVVAEPGSVLPDATFDAVEALLEGAAPKLDAAFSIQARDRAVRRAEMLNAQADGRRPIHQPDELASVVAALWSLASASVVTTRAVAATSQADAALVREACTGRTTAVAIPPAPSRALLPVDFAHRLAVATGPHTAILVEVPAAGEELDAETIGCVGVLARLRAIADLHDSLEADLRVLRHEDPETGCLAGTTLQRRIDARLATAGRGLSLLLLQADQLHTATDMELAARLGRALASEARGVGLDVYRVRPWRYAITVTDGTLRDARALAQRLRDVVRTTGAAESCTASIGIALAPVHGRSASELLDAAEHAMNQAIASGGDAEDVARQAGRARVAESDIYRRLEALRTLKSLADQHCHDGIAHADAVAQRATRIAVELGLDRQQVLTVQLAGELHEIGSLFVGAGETEEGPNAVRVLLSSRLSRIAGLHAVSAAIAAMHERVDGSGVPNREQGDDIPVSARILAVANAIETILDGLGRGDRGIDAAIRHVKDQAGAAYDRRIATIALAHIDGVRPEVLRRPTRLHRVPDAAAA